MFPNHAANIVENAGLNTIGKVASFLYDQGYRHATIVGGSDRIADLHKLLTDYNGVEGKAHGYYKFETLDAKSSGDREDGAEGVAGISASGARAAAANGDMNAFAEATGAGKYESVQTIKNGLDCTNLRCAKCLKISKKCSSYSKRKAIKVLGISHDI